MNGHYTDWFDVDTVLNTPGNVLRGSHRYTNEILTGASDQFKECQQIYYHVIYFHRQKTGNWAMWC